MKPVEFKQGDTFPLTCQYLENGLPARLPDGIRVQVRGASDTLVSELVVDRVDEDNGVYSATSETSDWPLGLLHIDVMYTYSNGMISRTPTVDILLVRSVTHD